MGPIKNFNSYIKDSIVDHWDQDALSDYKGVTLQYHDVARKIEKIHIMFESVGLKRGDKVALCGRNSAHWGVVFLATLSYGAVAIPIQHEFIETALHGRHRGHKPRQRQNARADGHGLPTRSLGHFLTLS